MAGYDIERYPVLMIFLHWTSAVMFFFLIAVGFYQSTLRMCFDGECFFASDEALELLGTHKTFGVLVFALVVVRLLIAVLSQKPTANALSNLELVLSKLVHGTLYCCLLFIPISGFFMHSAVLSGIDITVLGIEVPRLPGIEEQTYSTAYTIHRTLIWISILCVFLHVSGAMKHELFDKSPILYKMLPKFLKTGPKR